MYERFKLQSILFTILTIYKKLQKAGCVVSLKEENISYASRLRFLICSLYGGNHCTVYKILSTVFDRHNLNTHLERKLQF